MPAPTLPIPASTATPKRTFCGRGRDDRPPLSRPTRPVELAAAFRRDERAPAVKPFIAHTLLKPAWIVTLMPGIFLLEGARRHLIERGRAAAVEHQRALLLRL